MTLRIFHTSAHIYASYHVFGKKIGAKSFIMARFFSKSLSTFFRILVFLFDIVK